MTRLRLLLLVACAGALVGVTSAGACVPPDPVEPETHPARSLSALALLERAAQVARDTSWAGTQSILSNRGDLPRYELLRVVHTPGAGTVVEGLADNSRSVAPDLLDEDLFELLTRHYDLTVVGGVVLSGRRTLLVEAQRPGETGPSRVAGRFWVDRSTHMVWRRDVLDDEGVMTLSAAFSDLRLTRTVSAPVASPEASTAEHLGDAQLQELIDDGWPLVDHLPGGLEQFDALRHPDGVVQLSYSDGLSTLSLFVQEGALPDGTGGTLSEVGGSLVHVTSSAPLELVWSGGGRTWTLVSDAPESTIEQAVLVLPHADPPVVQEGMGEKVWRGMSRVGSWLNPFA